MINSALLKKNAAIDCRYSGPDKERGSGSDCAYAQSDPDSVSLLGYTLVTGTLYHVPKGAVDRGLISIFDIRSEHFPLVLPVKRVTVLNEDPIESKINHLCNYVNDRILMATRIRAGPWDSVPLLNGR